MLVNKWDFSISKSSSIYNSRITDWKRPPRSSSSAINLVARRKSPSSTANLAHGLGFPDLTAWDADALVWYWVGLFSLPQSTLTYMCVLTRSHSGWALSDPEDECRHPDLRWSLAYCQTHLCVPQEKSCVNLNLAVRFSLSLLSQLAIENLKLELTCSCIPKCTSACLFLWLQYFHCQWGVGLY